MNHRDTIAAVSTAPGRGGIGVVRVSGSDLAPLIHGITGGELHPRLATRCAFISGDGTVIDDGIALYFQAPRSYTGQDVLELHGHGGPIVMSLLLQRCLDLGARPANPGEFTQRAFLNGKLDLAQAEGVIDLIDASTAQAARSAVRSMRGEFSAEIDELNRQIIELRMLVEAALDFPEEDVELAKDLDPTARLASLRAQLGRVLEAARQGSILREGVHIVLAGAPNVGKSSLLNRLAGDELAIVTDVPGTTRDAIRQALDIAGVPVHVVDTAGLRDTEDTVERIGVERAWQAIAESDLVLLVTDDAAEVAGMADDVLARLPAGVPRIRVINKIDLTGREAQAARDGDGAWVSVSAKSGAGIDLLRDALLDAIGWRAQPEGVFLARERHLSALREASEQLAHAGAFGLAADLVAERLRLAHMALSSIVGEFSANDLLGEIFSRFCIGK